MSPSGASSQRVEGPAATAARASRCRRREVLEVLLGHRVEERAALGVDRAAVDEDLGQGPALGPRPGPEGGDELVLVDQSVLERQQAEEQVARVLSVGPWRPSIRRRCGRQSRRLDYRMSAGPSHEFRPRVDHSLLALVGRGSLVYDTRRPNATEHAAMNHPPLVSPWLDPTGIFELFRGNYATELLTAAVRAFDGVRNRGGEQLRRVIAAEEARRYPRRIEPRLSRPAAVVVGVLRGVGLLVSYTRLPLQQRRSRRDRREVGLHATALPTCDNPAEWARLDARICPISPT